jgi:hypothetical protein
MIRNDIVDTCPILDEELLDTGKISQPSPLPSHLHTFEREFGSPILEIIVWQQRLYLPLFDGISL